MTKDSDEGAKDSVWTPRKAWDAFFARPDIEARVAALAPAKRDYLEHPDRLVQASEKFTCAQYERDEYLKHKADMEAMIESARANVHAMMLESAKRFEATFTFESAAEGCVLEHLVYNGPTDNRKQKGPFPLYWDVDESARLYKRLSDIEASMQDKVVNFLYQARMTEPFSQKDKDSFDDDLEALLCRTETAKTVKRSFV